jgi:putative nucleotidyltransferase with HDIG domain
MRLATRTFLWSAVPFALLLTASFWAVQALVVWSVRDGLRGSLRESQMAIGHMRRENERHSSRLLRGVSESAALKAGIQLLLAEPHSVDARLTVEDQLAEIGAALGFDLLSISRPDGGPLAGVIKVDGRLTSMEAAGTLPPQGGLFTFRAEAYQVTSIPVDQADERIAMLSVGERLDFSGFRTPVVLTRHGKVIKASLPHVPVSELASSLAVCESDAECELTIRGETYLSLSVEGLRLATGDALRTLQSLDAALHPVQAVLRKVFLAAGAGAVLVAILVSAASTRSIVRPISQLMNRLHEAEELGLLPRFRLDHEPVEEIRELTESFNRAAAAIQEGRDNLHAAYVEFVGSLAMALDARDRYTAGHSLRVSEYSCAVARAMHLPAEEVEVIRIGALLHDIGKIGISDTVLQKPARLTPEEFALIKTHTLIGRKILEGVHGFAPYIDIVELHHENWDGSGYPFGRDGEHTPVGPRITHVADAYDAMTSDRPYRAGMHPEAALAILQQNAGTQFDPDVVAVFIELMHDSADDARSVAAAETTSRSLTALALAVTPERAEPATHKRI